MKQKRFKWWQILLGGSRLSDGGKLSLWYIEKKYACR